jgi:hypothetical protein
LIYWEEFNYKGKTYSLDHLHPMQWTLTQAAAQGKPERFYKFSVIFSLHTFAQEREDDHDPELAYSDSRETRTFCFHRYEASFQLQDVIFSLEKGHVYNTGHQNFLRIDKADGVYEVYFTVRRSKHADFDLEIYVQSAYKRTKGNSPNADKIRFYVVAYNRLHNKPIKSTRR